MLRRQGAQADDHEPREREIDGAPHWSCHFSIHAAHPYPRKKPPMPTRVKLVSTSASCSIGVLLQLLEPVDEVGRLAAGEGVAEW